MNGASHEALAETARGRTGLKTTSDGGCRRRRDRVTRSGRMSSSSGAVGRSAGVGRRVRAPPPAKLAARAIEEGDVALDAGRGSAIAGREADSFIVVSVSPLPAGTGSRFLPSQSNRDASLCHFERRRSKRKEVEAERSENIEDEARIEWACRNGANERRSDSKRERTKTTSDRASETSARYDFSRIWSRGDRGEFA